MYFARAWRPLRQDKKTVRGVCREPLMAARSAFPWALHVKNIVDGLMHQPGFLSIRQRVMDFLADPPVTDQT